MIETNVKTFLEKFSCFRKWTSWNVLTFLKIVTNWRKTQKSKLNNSLTNWVFQKNVSHFILSLPALFKLFICFAISWNFNFLSVLPRILLEIKHYKGEVAHNLLSFEGSTTYLYLFDAVHIQAEHNRLVGKAVVMEKVGNPVTARLLYLLIVVREFLEEFVFSVDNIVLHR